MVWLPPALFPALGEDFCRDAKHRGLYDIGYHILQVDASNLQEVC